MQNGTRGLTTLSRCGAAINQASRHAAQCPGVISRSGGTSPRQRSTAIGQRAREFVLPRFGVDRYVSTVAELYDRLLAGRAA